MPGMDGYETSKKIKEYISEIQEQYKGDSGV